jgi:hypothetical protein
MEVVSKNSNSFSIICILKNKSWKLITICWSKIMFITNMLLKKTTLWGDGAMFNDLAPQCGGEEFKSPHLQPRLPWLLK